MIHIHTHFKDIRKNCVLYFLDISFLLNTEPVYFYHFCICKESKTGGEDFSISDNTDDEQEKSDTEAYLMYFPFMKSSNGQHYPLVTKGQQCLPLKGCLAAGGQDARREMEGPRSCSSFFK